MLLPVAMLLGALTLIVYAPLLWGWIDQCRTDPSFSHALAVPLIAAYLVYLELSGKSGPSIRAAVRQDWLGYLVILLGGALLVAGERAAITFVARLSLLLVIAGIVLVLFGRRVMRMMAFPYGFLFLALPLPALIYLPFAFRLQLLSSALAASVLDLFGIPVLREGNVITLPNVSLQVVEACSGVHSLFALLTVALLAGYLFLNGNTARLLLALCAPPVAIAVNAARVTLLGVFSYTLGPESAEGFAHFSTGMVVFALGCIALLAVGYRLARREAAKSGPSSAAASVAQPDYAPGKTSTLALHTVGVAAVLLASAIASDAHSIPGRPQPIREPWADFPLDIANWHGRGLSLSRAQLDTLGTDSVLLREYIESGDPAPVSLYVAFFASQHEGTTMHSPLHCIPGAGWEVQKRTILPLDLNSDGAALRINEVMFRKEGRRALVLYWYMEQGESEPDELLGALKTLWNGAIHGRTDGCLIRFSGSVLGTEEAALAHELDLLHQTLPILIKRFLPPPPSSSAPRGTLATQAGL